MVTLLILSLFRCTQELQNLRPDGIKSSLHIQSGLAYTTRDFSTGRALVILSENSFKSFRIPEGGPGRWRFNLVPSDPREGRRDYFLHISTGNIFGRSQNELANEPQLGRQYSDYRDLQEWPLTSDVVIDTFARAILEEIKQLNELFRSQRMSQSDLLAGNLALCKMNSKVHHAQAIQRHVEELIWMSTPRSGARLPASL